MEKTFPTGEQGVSLGEKTGSGGQKAGLPGGETVFPAGKTGWPAERDVPTDRPHCGLRCKGAELVWDKLPHFSHGVARDSSPR